MADTTLRLKIVLRDVVRRFALPVVTTLSDLLTAIHSFYGLSETSSSSRFSLDYEDDEGDYVAFSTDPEWTEAKKVALAMSKPLKIRVLPDPAGLPSHLSFPVHSTSSSSASPAVPPMFAVMDDISCSTLVETNVLCPPSAPSPLSVPVPAPAAAAAAAPAPAPVETVPASEVASEPQQSAALVASPDEWILVNHEESASPKAAVEQDADRAAAAASEYCSPAPVVAPIVPAPVPAPAPVVAAPAPVVPSPASAPIIPVSAAACEYSSPIQPPPAPAAPALDDDMLTLVDSESTCSTNADTSSSVAARNEYAQAAHAPMLPMAKFIGDIQFPPYTQVEAESWFTKTWRIGNPKDAFCNWPEKCYMKWVDGMPLNGARDVHVVCPVGLRPRETADFTVRVQAPARLGQHNAHFRLHTPTGAVFGQVFSMHMIVVPKGSLAPPAPVEPVPCVAPSPSVDCSDASSLASSEADTASSTSLLPPVEILPPAYQAAVDVLVEMGFHPRLAVFAVKKAQGDLESALNELTVLQSNVQRSQHM